MLPRDYLLIVRKNLTFITGLAFFAAVAAGAFAYFQPVTYVTSFSFLIRQVARQETSDYQYDQYYALQASDLFAQTVVSWIESPEVVMRVLKFAQIDTAVFNPRKLAKFFKAKKESPQLVSVKFTTKNEEEAKKIFTDLKEAIAERTKALYQEQKNVAVFNAEADAPLILQSKPDIVLSILLGLTAGLVIGLTLIFVREYFR